MTWAAALALEGGAIAELERYQMSSQGLLNPGTNALRGKVPEDVTYCNGSDATAFFLQGNQGCSKEDGANCGGVFLHSTWLVNSGTKEDPSPPLG